MTTTNVAFIYTKRHDIIIIKFFLLYFIYNIQKKKENKKVSFLLTLFVLQNVFTKY